MSTLEPILAEHPFLKGLAPEHVKLLAGCASNAAFQPGQFLFRSGEPSNTFYIVRQGKVSVEIGQGGNPPLGIQTAGEGDVLGWSWLIPPHIWRFDGRAIELTRVIALDGACLRGKCDADHDLGYELLKRFSRILTQRLEATRLQLLDLYSVRP
jgi:CRP-like cAMP-binding protein